MIPINDITIPLWEDHGQRKRFPRVLRAGVATILIVAVMLNATMVFADDASGTVDEATSTAPLAVDAIPDVVTTSTATSSPDISLGTLPIDTAMTSVASGTEEIASSTIATSTDATSTDATSSEPVDPLVFDAASSTASSTVSSTASTTDGDVSSTIIISTDDASSTNASSTSADEASSTPMEKATTSPSSTDPLPAEAAVNVDDMRAQVRAELEKQVGAAYDNALQAQLAQAQEKLNATEQSDMSAMRDELTAQIKQQLQAGCLTFDDGSYFCVNPEAASGTYAAPAPYANVYAAKDPAMRNQQIFTQDSGAVTQITHTAYDNIQPVWNKDRTLIAWQGLVNDEWRIFVYDRRTGTTEMLEDEAANSINPTIDGSRIAWQGWDGNWEIYTAAPSSTGWQVNEVTHDTWANVEPQLAGGLLAWQSYRSGSWQIFVDSLASGEISQVSAGSGVNRDPHFLLTWQNEENGKSQSLQYDISSGAVSQLGAPMDIPAAAPLPESPEQKNGATLPAGTSSSSASSSTASSSKSQSDSENQ